MARAARPQTRPKQDIACFGTGKAGAKGL